MAAAQAGQRGQFDQVLEDVIDAALQRLMTANEHLFVHTQALAAAATTLNAGRTDGAAVSQARLDTSVHDAVTAARAEISEMRKSWDRVAQDVFAAFVERLVAQRGAGGSS
jgi:hypothetical protein